MPQGPAAGAAESAVGLALEQVRIAAADQVGGRPMGGGCMRASRIVLPPDTQVIAHHTSNAPEPSKSRNYGFLPPRNWMAAARCR